MHANLICIFKEKKLLFNQLSAQYIAYVTPASVSVQCLTVLNNKTSSVTKEMFAQEFCVYLF